MTQSRTTVVGWDVGELIEFIDKGIEHCRAGRWEKGAEYLGYVAERNHGGQGTAGLYFSYLGCAQAHVKKKADDEAVALCRHAVKVEFYQPENWANLADVLMLAGRRREAAKALRKGLECDPHHQRLLQLAEALGRRRRPLIGFLSRSNPVNHLLGRLRSDLLGPRRR